MVKIFDQNLCSKNTHFCILFKKRRVDAGHNLFLNLTPVKAHMSLVYKQVDTCYGNHSLLTDNEKVSTNEVPTGKSSAKKIVFVYLNLGWALYKPNRIFYNQKQMLFSQ